MAPRCGSVACSARVAQTCWQLLLVAALASVPVAHGAAAVGAAPQAAAAEACPAAAADPTMLREAEVEEAEEREAAALRVELLQVVPPAVRSPARQAATAVTMTPEGEISSDFMAAEGMGIHAGSGLEASATISVTGPEGRSDVFVLEAP
mmetsp:Transcript_48783/g.155996  ORF Transcript_48783/g.155996 Transcript_48783/m.155996 type:complete len:150 (-) Transcript_48783:69-518(-)